jgi:D-glycero-D-manno-heptose 1,7-bisphosphate phosphatase
MRRIMKRPAVFFDRDNTLIVSDGYLGDPSKVTLVSGAAGAVARARKLGFAVVVFSNQSGVARGMFTEEDVQAVNTRMEKLLRAEDAGAVIDRHEFCPFHPQGTIDVYTRESDRRKPKPGMILSAAKALALDLERSWVVGDAPRDIEAGKAAGCRGVLFSDPALKKSPATEMDAGATATPEHVATTLGEAVDFIERNIHAGDREGAGQPQAEAVVQVDRSGQTAVMQGAASGTEEPSSGVERAERAGIMGERWEDQEQRPAGQSTATVPGAGGGAGASAAAENPGKRVPKVAIGSRYVPPEGGEARPRTSRMITREAISAAQANGENDSAGGVSAEEIKAKAREGAGVQPPATELGRVEGLLEQIFMELRRQQEQRDQDFSVSKLLAGVVQIIALAVLFLGYLRGRGADSATLHTYLLVAIAMQTLTIALLIMSRQR